MIARISAVCFCFVLLQACIQRPGTHRQNQLPFSSFAGTSIKPVPDSSVLYKSRIAFGKTEFGGLLFIKKISDNEYRGILTTEPGIKIFDISVYPDSIRKNYCIKPLSKNFTLRLLGQDVRVLCAHLHGKDSGTVRMENGIAEISTSKGIYYFSENRLRRFILQNKGKKSAEAGYFYSAEKPADTIRIRHFRSPLRTTHIRIERRK
jgi:hypothetical protein